jgi:hypothetical protein
MTMDRSFLDGFVLKWECDWPRRRDGELTVDPDDPGGATRWGIDQSSHPHVDVRNLSYADAVAIYASEWTADGCDSLSDKVAQVQFDAAINCGLSRARTFLSGTDWSAAIDARDAFYRRLAAARPRLAKFLPGWLNRTADLRHFLAG